MFSTDYGLRTTDYGFFNGLYVITNESKSLGRSHYDVCLAALEGGARIVQYREKNKETAEMVKEATSLKKLCRRFNATFIVNDFVEVAKESDADGLHLGQNDEDFQKARQLLPKKIIGLSATSLQEAIDAERAGCDYIGAGPVFDTPSKDDAASSFGLQELSKICKSTNVPLVAIGGINKKNASSVVKAGADGIAVISAVTCANDMVKAVRDLIGQAKLAREK